MQEFACREVHENSGDWVIYFTNYTELCAFKDILETLWADANLVYATIFCMYKQREDYTVILDVNTNIKCFTFIG